LENTEDISQYLSAVTVGEIQKGILKLPFSKKRDGLGLWLTNVRTRYAGRLLPFTETTADLWAHMRYELETAGRVIPVLDSLIAATALEHDLTIVTRNTADFEGCGTGVLNPWPA